MKAARILRLFEMGGAKSVRRPAGQRLVRYGLGFLWLVDGLLQMQPGMFTMDMLSDIMQPAATGEPSWLRHLIDWSMALIEPRLVPVNWGIVALQLLIALLLLTPSSLANRLGAVLSLLWGLIVWVFGEALGQLLTGTASALTGAPGSALLYALLGALLLVPESSWRRWQQMERTPLTWFLALNLLLAAGLQCSPIFFTPLGVSAPFADAAMMPQPAVLRATLNVATSLSLRAPLVWNGLTVLAFLAAALFLLLRPRSRGVRMAVALLLFLVWWFGQDLGALTSGMATDPNTAPVLGLVLWADAMRGHELKERTMDGADVHTANRTSATLRRVAR